MLEAVELTKRYTSGLFRSKYTEAVSGVSFSLNRGEALGIVGESGCGKTTLARLLARLLEPTAGRVLFKGADIFRLGAAALREFRSGVQIIFQDYDTAFNPRWKMRKSLAEPLKLYRMVRSGRIGDRLLELIETVGLQPEYLNRYPFELSGGQIQRLALARVLALQPEVIVADEPTSSLDVSVQAQILSLLKDLQRQFQLTLLFITHDLDVARCMSDRVMVMFRGRIVEEGSTDSIFKGACHPYTRFLLASMLIPDPDAGDRKPDSEGDPFAAEVMAGSLEDCGCLYQPRCSHGDQICREQAPALETLRHGHRVACHMARYLEGSSADQSRLVDRQVCIS